MNIVFLFLFDMSNLVILIIYDIFMNIVFLFLFDMSNLVIYVYINVDFLLPNIYFSFNKDISFFISTAVRVSRKTEKML